MTILWVTLLAYGALQIIYVLFIEVMRWFDRRATPVCPYDFGPENAETCAVLVHGFADTPEAWRREAEVLATKGFRVLMPVISHTATEQEWLVCLEAVLRKAKTRHRRVMLWGHSMGGALALAVERRVPVDVLVLWAPFCAPWLGSRFTGFLHTLHRLLFLWPWTLTFFRAKRWGKGPSSTHYRVSCVIPTTTFAAMLRLPRLVRCAAPRCPVVLLLPWRDTVVDTTATLRMFPGARVLHATDPRSSHALTNAADWQDNLQQSLEAAVLQ